MPSREEKKLVENTIDRASRLMDYRYHHASPYCESTQN
jgi:hypothetical protein